MTAATALADRWYRPHLTALTASLLPLAWLYGAIVRVRRAAYARGWLATHRAARPVVVIGNLTVGGGGKTPATVALAHALAARGARPGIVSRGYGGSAQGPREVRRDDDPAATGDGALILAASGFPVFIARGRAGAPAALGARHAPGPLCRSHADALRPRRRSLAHAGRGGQGPRPHPRADPPDRARHAS